MDAQFNEDCAAIGKFSGSPYKEIEKQAKGIGISATFRSQYVKKAWAHAKSGIYLVVRQIGCTCHVQDVQDTKASSYSNGEEKRALASEKSWNKAEIGRTLGGDKVTSRKVAGLKSEAGDDPPSYLQKLAGRRKGLCLKHLSTQNDDKREKNASFAQCSILFWNKASP